MQLLCFSHLSWHLVFQRPQHLLTRFAREYDVFYFHEFRHHDGEDGYTIETVQDRLHIINPLLSHRDHGDLTHRKREVIDRVLQTYHAHNYISWYYTPLALHFTDHLQPKLVVYDCMDELSNFWFADPQLKPAEEALFVKADLVFTGGVSLYEAKKSLHPRVYAFPSSIDKQHFNQARAGMPEPADQSSIPHPRLGFFGVIDERLDTDLIGAIATLKPDWHFVLLGPVVKIDPAILPTNSNIHYLGGKRYDELPAYISSWDVALLPFALNDATKFISPTKTPEYLAAGKPVISTAIKDVVSPYGEENLVSICHTPEELVAQAEKMLTDDADAAWLQKVDGFLKDISWDNTYRHMQSLIEEALQSSSLAAQDEARIGIGEQLSN